ncbi:hypothetical protein WKT03_05825 [Coprococcus sp. HCN-4056]
MSRRRVGTGVFTNKAFTSNRKHSKSFTMGYPVLVIGPSAVL